MWVRVAIRSLATCRANIFGRLEVRSPKRTRFRKIFCCENLGSQSLGGGRGCEASAGGGGARFLVFEVGYALDFD